VASPDSGGQQGRSDANRYKIPQIEYGIAENNIANRFALSLNYEIQSSKNFNGIEKAALGGWQINTITWGGAANRSPSSTAVPG
jgi:hypothetical protein